MHRYSLSWIWLVAFSAHLFANQAATPAPPAAATSPNRITLDVVVNDKSGTPVAGIGQRDFTIVDNKQPQTIQSFQAIGPAADPSSEVILIIDAVNTSFTRVAYERDQVIKFLRQDGGRLAQPVSIDFLTDSGLQVEGAASRDGNALIEFLNQHNTPLRSMRRSQGFYGAADRAPLSLRAVGGLAEYEAKRPGRKIVVWLSPGWPLLSGPNVQLSSKDEQGIFNTIVGISTQLRLSRITLDTIDPLGTADAGGLRTSYFESFYKPVSAPKQTQFGNMGLQVFAHHSGGRVLNSSNDVAGEIESCIRDAGSYYVISYDSAPTDDPSGYHTVEVKINRPELKAQTLSGYYQQPRVRIP